MKDNKNTGLQLEFLTPIVGDNFIEKELGNNRIKVTFRDSYAIGAIPKIKKGVFEINITEMNIGDKDCKDTYCPKKLLGYFMFREQYLTAMRSSNK